MLVVQVWILADISAVVGHSSMMEVLDQKDQMDIVSSVHKFDEMVLLGGVLISLNLWHCQAVYVRAEVLKVAEGK